MFAPICTVLIAVLLCSNAVFSSPTNVSNVDIDTESLSPVARNVLKRSIPAAPRYVVYSDAFVSTTAPAPPPATIAGWNVFLLSFLTTFNADEYANWIELTAADRAAIKAEYAAAGISLCVSAFGSTTEPTTAGLDPVEWADMIAAAVIEFDLDGVDIDYEDFDAFNKKDGTAEAWLITFTTELRKKLPVGEYIVTHAPVAPWFISELYGGFGYTYVDQQVGDLIDWYNVQFYNQGATEYTTCVGLLTTSSSTWPGSSLFEIAARGVDLDKLVIGKPATTSDANNGFMTTTLLAQCAAEAVSNGWDAGIMSWQYPDANSAWIEAVKVGLTGVATTTLSETITSTATATTTTSTTTTTGTSGACAGVAAWVNSAVYTPGLTATFDGFLWEANQWNEDEVPGGASGAWTQEAAC